jgi:uncharacterized damage-inducible protein DinB
MAVSADVLREHLSYTAWASRTLVRAVEHLPAEHLAHDFQTSDRSILGTLVHVFAADRVWLGRIHGEPPPQFVSESDYDLRVLQIDWPLLYEKWHEWAATLTDQNVHEGMQYRDLKGNSRMSKKWEIVLHVVNHGTHHRGQVSGFLRTLGHTPPQLDLIRYYWEQQNSGARGSSSAG